jgi:membrane fusion protein (multidrug efflux system)
MSTYLNIRSILLSLIFCCAAAAWIISCGGAGGDSAVVAKKPTEVRVLVAAPSSIARTVELSGSVEPYRKVSLASPAEGPVISLNARQGDPVRVGDKLVEIGRRAGTNALIASLKEQLAKDEESLRRAKELALIEGISTQQLDLARATYESSKAQLVKAQETEGDFSLLAPWNGVVSDLMVEVGDFVSPRAALLEMYDPASLILRAEIPEHYAPNLRKGMVFSVTLDAYPDSLFSATIVRVFPYLDERMRTRTVEATVADPHILLPGMFARLSMKIGAVDKAMVVPNQALTVTPEGESIVFLLTNGAAKRQKIKTGIEDAGRIQILTGIQPGDTLITSGIVSLKDGMKVTPIIDGASADRPADAAKAASAKKPSTSASGQK